MTKYKLSRFKDRDTRKVFGTILGGKMLGILGALALMQAFIWLFGNVAEAAGLQEAATVSDDLVNPINTVWVLVAAFLVFFMQAGLHDAGGRASPGPGRSVNILLECIVDTCLCGILFWAFGFAFMFGAGNGLIGHEFFFLHDAPATYDYGGRSTPASRSWRSSCSSSPSPTPARRSPRAPWSAAPASRATCSTASACRGFIYPIIGHWVWGPGGWLATPWAGSTASPDGIVVPRLRRLDRGAHGRRHASPSPAPSPSAPASGASSSATAAARPRPHDLTIAAIGARDPVVRLVRLQPRLARCRRIDFEGIGRVATNTTLAACAGGLVAVFFVYPRSKKWDVGHDHQRLPRRPRGHHRALLLGHHRSARSSSAPSPAIIVPLGVDLARAPPRSTTRSARSPSTASAASGARWPSGCSPPATSASPARTGADTSGRRSRASSTAAAPDQLVAQLIGSLTCIVVVVARRRSP